MYTWMYSSSSYVHLNVAVAFHSLIYTLDFKPQFCTCTLDNSNITCFPILCRFRQSNCNKLFVILLLENFAQEICGGCGSNQVPTNIGQLHHLWSQRWSSVASITSIHCITQWGLTYDTASCQAIESVIVASNNYLFEFLLVEPPGRPIAFNQFFNSIKKLKPQNWNSEIPTSLLDYYNEDEEVANAKLDHYKTQAQILSIFKGQIYGNIFRDIRWPKLPTYEARLALLTIVTIGI